MVLRTFTYTVLPIYNTPRFQVVKHNVNSKPDQGVRVCTCDCMDSANYIAEALIAFRY